MRMMIHIFFPQNLFPLLKCCNDLRSSIRGEIDLERCVHSFSQECTNAAMCLRGFSSCGDSPQGQQLVEKPLLGFCFVLFLFCWNSVFWCYSDEDDIFGDRQFGDWKQSCKADQYQSPIADGGLQKATHWAYVKSQI